MNEYHKQAMDTLKAVGAKLIIREGSGKAASWTPHGLHWRCTLSQGGRRYTFDFWNSRAAGAAAPAAYDVLACLDWHCPDDFESFCADFGYDTDSRKAHATWEACVKGTKALHRVIENPEHRDILAEVN